MSCASFALAGSEGCALIKSARPPKPGEGTGYHLLCGYIPPRGFPARAAPSLRRAAFPLSPSRARASRLPALPPSAVRVHRVALRALPSLSVSCAPCSCLRARKIPLGSPSTVARLPAGLYLAACPLVLPAAPIGAVCSRAPSVRAKK